jgi:hypothetical protein
MVVKRREAHGRLKYSDERERREGGSVKIK